MKYIILKKDEITREMLSLINQDEVTEPIDIFIQEPNFEEGIHAIPSDFSYITTEDSFPNGFAEYKKLSKDKFDETVLLLKSGKTINDSIYNKIYNKETSTFTSKILPQGKRLYKRVHGVKKELTQTTDTISMIIPYDMAKINGIEIIGSKLGDTCNFKAYDTSEGTISGYPNILLNQFGFDVNIRPEYHSEISSYEADLILGMKLEVEFTGSVGDLIGINFILHEVK